MTLHTHEPGWRDGLPPSMAERRAALLEDASAKLRDAARALEGISGLVPDVVYLDWNRKTTDKLPLGYRRVLLGTIADTLEKRAQEGNQP